MLVRDLSIREDSRTHVLCWPARTGTPASAGACTARRCPSVFASAYQPGPAGLLIRYMSCVDGADGPVPLRMRPSRTDTKHGFGSLHFHCLLTGRCSPGPRFASSVTESEAHHGNGMMPQIDRRETSFLPTLPPEST